MIAIKNMKMPKSCTECEMTHEDDQSCDICEFTYSNVTYEVRNNLKSFDCPLVELEEYKGKLEKIKQIIDDCDSGMISCEQLFLNLRTILEQE